MGLLTGTAFALFYSILLRKAPGFNESLTTATAAIDYWLISLFTSEAQRNATIYGLGGLAATARNAAIALLPGPMHLHRLDWLYRLPDD